VKENSLFYGQCRHFSKNNEDRKMGKQRLIRTLHTRRGEIRISLKGADIKEGIWEYLSPGAVLTGMGHSFSKVL